MDWWSLGTLIYEMISGLPPFYDRNKRIMYNKILSSPLAKCSYMSPEISLRMMRSDSFISGFRYL